MADRAARAAEADDRDTPAAAHLQPRRAPGAPARGSETVDHALVLRQPPALDQRDDAPPGPSRRRWAEALRSAPAPGDRDAAHACRAALVEAHAQSAPAGHPPAQPAGGSAAAHPG